MDIIGELLFGFYDGFSQKLPSLSFSVKPVT
jgi:hypothetical protein